MGIFGLHSYICYEIPQSMNKIYILDEIDKYKRIHGKDPVIIINLWTIFNHFKLSENIHDECFGKRINLIKDQFERFLSRLVEHGAKLIFVCKRIRFNEIEFNINGENEYVRSQELLNVMKESKTTNEVVNFINSRPKIQLSQNEIVFTGLVQSAQKFGKLCGKKDLFTKQSTHETELASKEDALAILGSDTHYLFYKGQFQMWSDMSLKMNEMSVMKLNKNIILNHFGLTYDQLKLFVALAGGLLSSYENIMEIKMFFKHCGMKVHYLKRIAYFVQPYKYPLSEETLRNVVKRIFKRNIPQLIEEFTATFASFESNETIEEGANTKLMEFFKDEYLSFGQEILFYRKLYISSVNLDLNDDKGLLKKLVLPWIKKTCEALLKDEDDAEPICLMIKNSHEDLLSEHEIKVGNCEFPIPSLEALVFGLMNDSDKMKLFDWITGLTTANFEIPVKYLSNIIILLHLIKNKAIVFFEAVSILQTIVDVNNNSEKLKIEEYPVKVDVKAYRASILFQKLYLVLSSCLSCVGLKNLVTDYNFDNVHYQIIYSDMKSTDDVNVKNESEMIMRFMNIINCD
ncbi:unnamed protein product [Diamesa hyperborea]